MNTEITHHELSFARRYLFSTDHKVIAKQNLTLSLFWAVIGAATAYLIRWQIAHPDTEAFGWGYIEPQVYNSLVTMHGTIMVFFVAMPLLLSVFGNFLIPRMIGAKDMAFPKLNALSFWIFFLSSVVLFVSFFVPGGAAAAGWTGYPPLSAKNEYTGGSYGMDLWRTIPGKPTRWSGPRVRRRPTKTSIPRRRFYRWPYDYSLPDAPADWLPQNNSDPSANAAAR